ncbi:pilus assembly protein PilB [uncultured Marinobacter sp.]|uniref:pilus assembly protein PilB n=1 Tax=uncultured Marinobacter sp. TaxID=187379 RepID=UPI002631B42D|nr:pilus assembly protein PilB [uncultured Marinobacter sp.]
MDIRQGFEEKSRLGRLLVNRGYLSSQQLEEGLRLQRETGQRLGEALIQAGWITERELFRVLKQQSRYRNAAALFTVVTLPLQPLVSFAAGPSASAAQDTLPESAELMQQGKGISPLSDADLARVSGQGDQTLVDRIAAVGAMVPKQGDADAEPDVLEGIKLTAHIFVPVLNFLDSDLTITGVHYRDDGVRHRVDDDGRLTLAFPERIEEIRMDNIRVSGGHTPPLGNVSISDIRFDPDSRMTVYTR